LTLTVDPKCFPDGPRSAFESTASFVPELIRALRLRFGPVEYLRVTELHKSGFPHYHLLVRSAFLPHAVVKNLWNKYTGATIVDLKPVNASFRAYTYLTKYLTKMHKLDWTERHVSYSRNFFPPTKKPDTPDLGDFHRYNDHPFVWLAEHCPDQVITQLASLTWLLVPTTLSQRKDF
jgi:hypothetical protein